MKNIIKKKLAFNNRVASILGYFGALPFIFTAFSVWFINDKLLSLFFNGIIAYSYIIFTFIGAVYWGLGLSISNEVKSKKYYLFSIGPSLCAWLIFFIEFLLLYKIVLVIIFLNIFILIEKKLLINDVKLKWFLYLRIKLNLLVTVSLLAIILKLSVIK